VKEADPLRHAAGRVQGRLPRRPILQALIDAGRGDVPLTRLKFRCSNCGSDRTDFVVTSRDDPQPW
jgi:hypothetical protein